MLRSPGSGAETYTQAWHTWAPIDWRCRCDRDLQRRRPSCADTYTQTPNNQSTGQAHCHHPPEPDRSSQATIATYDCRPPLYVADLLGVRAVGDHQTHTELPLELLDRARHGRVGVVLLAKEVVHRVADLKRNGPLRWVVDLYLVKGEALPLEGVLAADAKAWAVRAAYVLSWAHGALSGSTHQQSHASPASSSRRVDYGVARCIGGATLHSARGKAATIGLALSVTLKRQTRTGADAGKRRGVCAGRAVSVRITCRHVQFRSPPMRKGLTAEFPVSTTQRDALANRIDGGGAR